jgi:hypothetical protein
MTSQKIGQRQELHVTRNYQTLYTHTHKKKIILQLSTLARVALLHAPARREPHGKHNFPFIVTSMRLYSSVAWQRIVQIRY